MNIKQPVLEQHPDGEMKKNAWAFGDNDGAKPKIRSP